MPEAAEQQSGISRGLDVLESVGGKRWVIADPDPRMVEAIMQTHNVPEIISRLLAERGVKNTEVEGFLTPTLKSLIPNPSRFQDMDKAVVRIISAIEKGEKIVVFGDYDVDGATSSALLVRFFRSIGFEIEVYIPDRIDEGYGPSAEAFLELKDKGADLVITVDCGVTAYGPLEAADEAALDVIVLDHHVAEPNLPKAVAIVNPNRLDEDQAYGYMAAVGVVFVTIVAVNRALRGAGFYQSRQEPDLTQWLDLVALGTVCDVVPLVGLNRAFVQQGLKIMARRQNPGLKALSDVASIKEAPTGFHLGFVLGPRVNAGGRVGKAHTGSRLLSTEDKNEAITLAHELNDWNNERKAIERDVLKEAEEMLKSTPPGDVVLVAKEGWHPGVIGIVASRLKEKYSCPACVIALDNGIGKASGRSVDGVDLGAAIIAARQKEILISGGGHEMAAGFTVAEDKISDLHDFLSVRILKALDGKPAIPPLRIDAVLSPTAVNMKLAELLEKISPYGAGNPHPRFALTGARVSRVDVVGENHLRCFISDTSGGGGLKAIAFRALNTPLGDALMSAGRAPLNLAGKIEINRWNGMESVQFQIEDAATVF